MQPGLVDYELEREERIQQNKQKMQQFLGEKEAYAALNKPKPPPRRPNRVRIEAPSEAGEASRRSGRIASLPAKEYSEAAYEEMLAKAMKKTRLTVRTKTGRRVTSSGQWQDRSPGWNPNMGMASDKASGRALEEAVELVENLTKKGTLASIKEMSGSQVSGGFWANLPSDFARTFGIKSKCEVTLEVRTCGMIYNWHAIWLPRKEDTAGLSGGWRGFAIDNLLFPNDIVVFEKTGPLDIRVHCFRAAVYDKDFQQPAHLQKVLESGPDTFFTCRNPSANEEGGDQRPPPVAVTAPTRQTEEARELKKSTEPHGDCFLKAPTIRKAPAANKKAKVVQKAKTVVEKPPLEPENEEEEENEGDEASFDSAVSDFPDASHEASEDSKEAWDSDSDSEDADYKVKVNVQKRVKRQKMEVILQKPAAEVEGKRGRKPKKVFDL